MTAGDLSGRSRQTETRGGEAEGGKPPSSWLRAIQFCYALAAFAALPFLAVSPATWLQQAISGAVLVAIALCLNRKEESTPITLALIFLSLFATCRYAYWRIHTVADFLGNAVNHVGALDSFFILLLASAEFYAFLILLLGYMQTIRPLRRAPAALPDDLGRWPEVDLLIPTYNEPLEVVRYTALAALNIDWPVEKLHVYLLDDGRREDFRRFAEEAGIGYMTRADNRGAKAGNINRALEKTRSPYVAIFDSDHVPTRSFLQVTMGWFLRDRKLAMLQTPHHFYSPDPFERNLKQFRDVPNEGELFYGIVQDGNDFWNAAFFCGSCAVLRRSALDQVGGIATETVTEDAHTSLRLQTRGWNTAYINIPQAAGLATESLSGHVNQRIRWARGMVQVLRVENPLFAPGLKLPQRLCYFNAMMHFLYAVPRLIFLTAPLLYLVFSRSNIPGHWAAILAFALPHLMLSSITNSRVQGRHRHSFWNEIYETVLAPYILLPTWLALVNPKLGKFNVTAKGGVVRESYFDGRTARPFVLLLGLNLLGLFMAVPRLVHLPGLGWLWDGKHPGTVAMNCLWTVFNLVILGVATAVAQEAQQRRQHVRLSFAAAASVILPNGTIVSGQSIDFSNGGVALKLAESADVKSGAAVKVVFPIGRRNAVLPAIVRGNDDGELRLQFETLTLEEEEALTALLYSRADNWLGWSEGREADRPLRSFLNIVELSLRGVGIALRSLLPMRKRESGPASFAAGRVLPLLLIFGVSALCPLHSQAQARNRTSVQAASVNDGSLLSEASFDRKFSFREIGRTALLEFHGAHGYVSIDFGLPATELARQALLHLVYRFAPGAAPEGSGLRLSLNGAGFLTLPVQSGAAGSPPVEQAVDLPADLLVRHNRLTFEFLSPSAAQCTGEAASVISGAIEPESGIEVRGTLVTMADALEDLPLPFFDPALSQTVTIPVAFVGEPSARELQAAGIVASHFGILGGYRGVRFPVSIGRLPQGNAILIAEDAGKLPPGFGLGGITAPAVAIRSNPADPWSKVLIVTGAAPGQLIAAAQTVALGSPSLYGPAAVLSNPVLPAPRRADDAPGWVSTKTPVPLADYIAGPAEQDGSAPFNLYLKLPPDLYYANRPALRMVLGYRYGQARLAGASSIRIFMNRFFVGSLPLPPGPLPIKIVRSRIDLPVSALRPFSNSMSLAVAFHLASQDSCDGAVTPGKIEILKSSSLDLRGIPHWTTLPNLELFANAGYPFTRYADLRKTTVVLPSSPSPGEIELYLTLMGHFAAQTGYPALRVRVAGAEALQDGADRDFLVIGDSENQPALARLAPSLPAPLDGAPPAAPENASLRLAGSAALGFLKGLLPAPSDREDSTPTVTNGAGPPDGVIEGFQSPYAPGHSVVVIAVGGNLSGNPLAGAFLKVSQSSEISGAVSVLRGGEFHSYRLSGGRYSLGFLPWRYRLSRWLIATPWLTPFAVLVLCLPLAWSLHGWLERRARRRLES